MKYKFLAQATVLFLLLTGQASLVKASEVQVFPYGSPWKYFVGTQEASSPTTAWRATNFNDVSWPTGNLPIGYANPPNDPGGYEATIATQLPLGTTSNYLSVFLRKTFTVANPENVSQIVVDIPVDDGYVVWINGKEIGRYNVPGGEILINVGASGAFEPTLTSASTNGSVLMPGNNVIALQLVNQTTGSSDLFVDARMRVVVDDVPPAITALFPDAGSTVAQLFEIQVQFSEDVAGVDASDLLVNNMPCTNLSVIAADNFFAFQFPQPPTGLVQVAWSVLHGIQDKASTPNNFAGGNWTYHLDTNLPTAILHISEFLADNSGDGTNGIRDEDGDNSDWIEIRNAGSGLASLNGWFLTDNPNNLTKWRFPNVTLPAEGYLIVFASEKDKTNINGRLHTNFRLNTEGEYLALVNPQTNVVSEFPFPYEEQFEDVSYGRDRVDANIIGYFPVPTPGAPNSSVGAGFAPPVQFSRSGGPFVSAFSLTLSTSSGGASIRYTTDGSAPTASSTLYSGPINISTTTRIRARSFQAGLFPGPVRSESYLLMSSALNTFSSDLPIVVVHTFGQAISGGLPTPDTAVYVSIFEPSLLDGRTSLTNPPVLTTRAGMNVRGATSAGRPKRPYAVEFWDEDDADRELPVLGMPEESDWILYAPNVWDQSLMHNCFIYEVSNEIGRYAAHTRYVELYLKDDGGAITSADYDGIYVVMEKIKRDNNRVDIEPLEAQHTNAATITGGYLLQNTGGRNDPNERTFAAGGLTITYQDPDGLVMVTPQRAAQSNYIRTYFNDFNTALQGSSWTNPVTGYAAYIDVDSWIDHHQLDILGWCVDALRLSAFFFKDRDKKVEFGPIWDFDRGLGTGSSANGDYRCFNPRLWKVQAGGDQGTDFFGTQTQPWWNRLFLDIDFWQRYIDRWQELRKTTYDTNHLFEIVDGFANTIREAQPRDQVRWQSSSDGIPRTGQVNQNGYSFNFDGTYFGTNGEVAFQKKWIYDRVNFVDTNFLAAPVLSAAGGMVSTGATIFISGPTSPANSTVYYTLDGTDPRLPGGAINPAALIYSGPITITNNVRLFARAYNVNHRNVINANCPNGGCPPLTTPWSGKAVETYFTSIPALRITEIMYHPQNPPPGNTNEDANFEYVEVKNIGSTPLNLNRFRLSGGIEFDFPNTLLQAGSNIVVVSHLAAFQSRYGTNTVPIAGVFSNRLDNAGERLILEGPVREPILDFSYDDEWYPITDGFGFSLVIVNENAALNTWGFRESWRPSSAINGSPGRDDGPPPVIPQVVINEVLTHSDPPPPTDSIELHNLSLGTANIGGWFLTDDFSNPKKYRISNGTTVDAGDFIVFNESQFNSGPNSFSLSSLGEEVYLFSGDANTNLTGYFHGFDFGPAENGVTFGRYVISTGEDQFPSQTTLTLGDPNSGPRVGPVVISEIMYHPPDIQIGTNRVNNTDDEYIELHNFSASPAPLYHTSYPSNTWRLRNAVDFNFPTNVTLPPNGRLLVVDFNPADTNRLAEFRTRNGVSPAVPIYGPFIGNLDNETEAIELRKPDAPEPPGPPNFGLVPYVLVERVRYTDNLPWPPGADGIGPSLQRLVASAYGNDPSNWVAATKSPGAPYAGGVPPVITSHPTNKTIVGYTTVMFSVAATGPNLSYQWLFNGSTIAGATNPTLTLMNVDPSQAGQYRAIVLNPAASVASSNATLTVRIPPGFTRQPTTVILRGSTNVLTWGHTFSNVTFSVTATGSPPVTYQWRFNEVNIPGATSPTLVVSNAIPANEGTYDVIATDGLGSPRLSTAAILRIDIPPLIYEQAPVNTYAVVGETVNFTVGVTGSAPFGFRWRRDGIPYIPFPSSPTLTVSNVTLAFHSNRFSAVVTNAGNLNPGVVGANAFLFVLADTDGDRMPDSWEMAYGFNPTNSMDGTNDFDGDTMINRDEWVAGTDPIDPESYLKVDQISPSNGATLTFIAVSNKTYTVQYVDALDSAVWLRLTNISAQLTNRIAVAVDPASPPGRYYRLRTPRLP